MSARYYKWLVCFFNWWGFQSYRIANNASIIPIATNTDKPTVPPTVTATLSGEWLKVSKETDTKETNPLSFNTVVRFVSNLSEKKA